MLSTKDIKVKFLGITPVMEDVTGKLTPQEIVAFSGLLTYSGKSIDAILKETRDKGQDIAKKIKGILRKSSLKGHASMATTPVITFSYEASKFIDSGLTGMVFASAIMASGRRTDTTNDDIVYPTAIQGDNEATAIYKTASQKNIQLLNKLLEAKIDKDEASKILQYGIYGTGIIQFPIESLVTLKREYEAEKKWMPEDIGFLISAIEKELKNYGVDLLYATRVAAPRNTYPYPNIFKDPALDNLARDIAKSKNNDDNFKIVSSDLKITDGLKNRLQSLQVQIKSAAAQDDFNAKWPKLLQIRQQIARDYAAAVNIKIYSSTAWRVWGDKKRHRTVPMVVDSVYACVNVCANVFGQLQDQIDQKKLTHEMIDKIDSVFSLPPAICQNKAFLYEYLECALGSLNAYRKLVATGIKESDAIFVIPRGLKLNIVQDYNLYNLIAGYYPLRICSTAEEELKRLSIKEVTAIKSLLQEKKLDWLAEHIVSKCQAVGFCLEESCCGIVKNLAKNYDPQKHEQSKIGLEEKFQKILKEIE